MTSTSRSGRSQRLWLLFGFLPLCWLGMMAVHEFGHVLGAWATRGSVQKVVLHPLAISRTDVSPNPHPLIVVWMGPIVGVFIPLAIWAISYWWQIASAFLWRFFAGFCWVANGAYLGVGSFEWIGDAGELLKLGMPTWSLWMWGLLSVSAGFACWNGLGPHFGWGGISTKNPHTTCGHRVGIFGVIHRNRVRT